ncbi:iron ABC transporter substrate-binding protein [Nocardia sp. NEAU-G5]|uniref:Iron ABC transporter substrate-binding protein n=1 Tax=Nocardia albiluteola TaxID=2842303 RepID=A0ABS6B173_9NOCA|nr:iron ABC transporter substrate-binding protein [Nocardia albiluteola]MBU3063025.1 iron ABC transporter substrate-binding protein [Nocardia albiluteola]
MSRSLRTVVALAAASAAVLSIAGCSSSKSSSDSITLYSGQHEQTVTALVKDFQQRTGVTVNVRSGDEAELANQILQEGDASPADAYFAENPPALTLLEGKNKLAKVDGATLSAVPAEVSSDKGDWVGVSARSAAFVYNTGKVQAAQAPTSVKDLAGPAWKGRLGVAPSETDFAPIVSRMIAASGVDATRTWLQGLKDNGKVYQSNEDLIAAVDRGEVEGGVVDHYYWYRLREEKGAANIHSALSYFAPGDPGALVDISGAAVLASSKHQAAAQKWLAYLVSRPAQQIIATSESFEYPLVSGVSDARLTRSLQDSGPIAKASDLGDGKQAIELMQETGLLS